MSQKLLLILFSRIGYQVPMFAGFCIMFISTISKCCFSPISPSTVLQKRRRNGNKTLFCIVKSGYPLVLRIYEAFTRKLLGKTSMKTRLCSTDSNCGIIMQYSHNHSLYHCCLGYALKCFLIQSIPLNQKGLSG